MSEAVELIVIMDRSGSMMSIAEDAIGGFNSFVEQQKKEEGAANLTLVLFDHEYLLQIDSQDIQKIEPLTSKTYIPRGNTALLDSIGRALGDLQTKNPKKAIICIITDGYENASKEFTKEMVKDAIDKAEAKGWQVEYLAANQDAFSVGQTFGIKGGFAQSFKADAEGIATAYMSMSLKSSLYRSSN